MHGALAIAMMLASLPGAAPLALRRSPVTAVASMPSPSQRPPAPRQSLPPEKAAWRGNLPEQKSLPLLEDGTPDYTSIDRSPISMVLTATIRKLLVEEVGKDEDPLPWTNFKGVMTSVREVNDMDGTAAEVQGRAMNVFKGILPSLGIGWVPPVWLKLVKPSSPEWLQNFAFFVVFKTLFPWLMGPMEGVEEVEVPLPEPLRKTFPFLPASVMVPQAVKAERCRFLETAQCASVCVNTCKIPSQAWLREDFGMPIHIQPNYDDFSCVWRFGIEPPPIEEDEAVMVPCFANCDSNYKGEKDALRQRAMKMGVDGAIDGASFAAARVLNMEGGATPGGTALSAVSLQARERAVKSYGKCWSVAEDREEQRSPTVEGSGDKLAVRWEFDGDK